MSIKFDDPNQEDIIADINLTPLIDIMLVLLIIFMVTSSVSLDSGLDIDLPKTQAGTSKKENSAIIISLDKAGELFVEGKQVSFDNALESIKEALVSAKTDLVVLEGDQHASLGKTVEVMELAKKAGAQRFAIAASSDK